MIVVLEDEPARIVRLRRLIGARELIWERDVTSLLTVLGTLAALDVVAQPSLVILDHDLGGPVSSCDVNGLTGLDAAERMPVVDCPVLVWSYNPVRAPIMVSALKRRGMRAQWAMFGMDECDAIIRAAIKEGER